MYTTRNLELNSSFQPLENKVYDQQRRTISIWARLAIIGWLITATIGFIGFQLYSSNGHLQKKITTLKLSLYDFEIDLSNCNQQRFECTSELGLCNAHLDNYSLRYAELYEAHQNLRQQEKEVQIQANAYSKNIERMQQDSIRSSEKIKNDSIRYSDLLSVYRGECDRNADLRELWQNPDFVRPEFGMMVKDTTSDKPESVPIDTPESYLSGRLTIGDYIKIICAVLIFASLTYVIRRRVTFR